MPGKLDPCDLGAIGDGASHPLYMYYSTLASAQDVYPHVTSLNQEKSWASIQQALNMVAYSEGSWYGIQMSPGVYQIGADTLTYIDASRSLVFEGAGSKVTTTIKSNGAPIVLDLCGSSQNSVKNISFITEGSGTDVGLLLARPASGASPNGNIFENVDFSGSFNKATVYSINAECNVFLDCNLKNTKADHASYTFYTSSENDLSVISQGGTLKVAADNATDSNCQFIGGSIMHLGTGVGLAITGAVRSWTFQTYVYSNYRNVLFDKTSANDYVTGPISFRDCLLEGTGATLVYFNDAYVCNVSFDHCNLYCDSPESGYAVYQPNTNKFIDNLSFRYNSVNPAAISLYIIANSELTATATVRFVSDNNRWLNCTPTYSNQTSGDMIVNVSGAGMPRYTTTQRGSLAPVAGQVVYNASTNKLNVYNGTTWEAVTSA
jgi:hypothetical protein